MPSSDAPRRRRRWPRRLLALLVALAGVELALRVLPIKAFALDSIRYDVDHTRYVPHPYEAYVPRPNWDEVDATTGQRWHHNSLGFRGPEFTREKPAGTLRIFCLGGSSTYGHTESDDEHTWPEQLQKLLTEARPGKPIQVINAGVSGRNSYEMTVDIAVRLTDLQPDLYIYYESINDVFSWCWPGIKPDNTHWRAVWPTRERSWLTASLDWSRTFLVARRYLTDYWQAQDLGSWVIHDFGKRTRLYDDYQPEGPVFFARNLQSMISLARGHGARIALGTQACYLKDLKEPSVIKGLAKARETILAVGAAQDVPVVDVFPALAQDRALFANDVHCTDLGSACIARTWADFLLEQGLIDG
jgi:lysophospholipase L1-like esterase